MATIEKRSASIRERLGFVHEVFVFAASVFCLFQFLFWTEFVVEAFVGWFLLAVVGYGLATYTGYLASIRGRIDHWRDANPRKGVAVTAVFFGLAIAGLSLLFDVLTGDTVSRPKTGLRAILFSVVMLLVKLWQDG